MTKLPVEVGQRYNRLTILSIDTSQKYRRVFCQCDCGNKTDGFLFAVYKGDKQSCGCLWKESRKMKKTKPRSDIKPNGGSAGNYVFLYYRRNAERRGYEFYLTKEQFHNIVTQPCSYCGSNKSQSYKYATPKKSEAYYYSGVDRKDNKQGYTLQNSVPCCKICNRAKDTLTAQEFRTWVERIYNHDSSKSR